MATDGKPCLLVWASRRKAEKSSPMACITRGPARIMALTVENQQPSQHHSHERCPCCAEGVLAAT